MNDFGGFQKTTRTKPQRPHNGTPQRHEKRKEWQRSTHKRTQAD